MNLKYVIAVLSLLGIPSSVRPADLMWIWKGEEENVEFTREFTLQAIPDSALLKASGDDRFELSINGERIAKSSTYDEPVALDAAKFLVVGKNTISISAQNRKGSAGFLFEMKLEGLTLESNQSWKVRPRGGKQWAPAEEIAKYGDEPWGRVFDQDLSYSATRPEQITVAKDFEVELLYSVNKHTQGSWVAMTVDPEGRLITTSQDGQYFRMYLEEDEVRVEDLVMPISEGGTHGILYAFDSLYVLRYSKGQVGGLHRLTDTDDDGVFDRGEQLKHFVSGGEHGIHSLVPGPDGQSIYLVGGNFTELPEVLPDSAVPTHWGEDQLLPRLWDPQGHAKGKLAPGGFIMRTDPGGTRFELVSIGYRNPFDAAFNLEGELFTFDADMEWDLGLPWYRPTRINHVVSGSDYGWRSGSGKWTEYFPDSLPAAVNVGPGSPTGVASGKGARFPEKYQRALFCNDWTSGTIYAIHLQANGASYQGTTEDFLSGVPLPLTDALIHPKDGNLYFMTGGRSTQSGLYRVKYVGSESTEPVELKPVTEEVTLRRSLEKLHLAGDSEKVIAIAWPHLSHPDRFIRYAARVAVEKQPVAEWLDRVWEETEPTSIVESIIALARASSDPALQATMIDKLLEVDFEGLDRDAKLGLLRAYQLVFIRTGDAREEVREKIIAELGHRFPAYDSLVDIELAKLLIYLGDPKVTGKAVFLMMSVEDDWTEMVNSEILETKERFGRRLKQMRDSNQAQIALAFALREAKAGWTPELYQTYFSWFPHAQTWLVGSSVGRYLETCRHDALAKVGDPALRSRLAELSRKAVTPSRRVRAPEGPGQNWTVQSALRAVEGNLVNRAFKSGENLFHAAACASCHRFDGEGGGIGPDLTMARNRYSLRDLLENIIDPSEVISDQYGSTNITKKDGSQVIGRIGAEENGALQVMTNPFNPDVLVNVPVEDIASREPWNISSMPPGLINTMNANELSDLIAYILSAGNPKEKYFGSK